jgi:hypothetical protein
VARRELSETLTALVGGVSFGDAMTVVEVELEVPMEVVLVRQGGRLVVEAGPGHTRFVSGFLPPVHSTRLRVVAEMPTAPPGAPSPGGWPS